MVNLNSGVKGGCGMPKEDTLMRIVYEHSGEEKQVPLSTLVSAVVEFLDHFSVKSLVGPSFIKIIRAGDGLQEVGPR